MDDQQIRQNFSNNLVRLRKMKGLNQNELASIFNYSNKAISKWETGETIPDITILKMIADYFGITIDELISREDVVDEKKSRNRRYLITFVSTGLTYLVAAIIFLFLNIFNVPKAWLTFIAAVPASAIVLIVFTALWFKKIYLYFSILLLIWTLFTLAIILFNNILLPSLIIAIVLSLLFAVFIIIIKK